MSEPLTEHWRTPLTLADPQRQPRFPSLIAGHRLTRFPDLDGLAQDLAERLAGRRPLLVASVLSWPDFDTFPGFSVHAVNPPGAAGGPPTAEWLCAVAVQDTTPAQLEAAIAEHQQKAQAA